ncbi:MAG: macro domain-containing protein [Blautia sp.]|nr:macro domain-containing protein [Blautia sp.]
MASIQIQKIGITQLDTDAIVNAANEGLLAGGGVCGAIFRAAGYEELTAACEKYGHCPTGSAVITPGFALRAKYVIHAVGPIWQGGRRGESELLYNAYKASLRLAVEAGCHSIGFPLISSGIYGYPKEQAWERAISSCRDFLLENEDVDMRIVFAVLDEEMLQMGQRVLAALEG